MAINAVPVEALIVVGVLHRLDAPELAAALEGRRKDEPDAARFRLEVDEAQAQLAELGEAYANKLIGITELTSARKLIDARLDSARKQLARLTRSAAFGQYVGHGADLGQQWDSFDLSRQHAIVEALTERVVVAPGRRGYNRFDSGRVTAVWRG
jgi:hypothetical protein